MKKILVFVFAVTVLVINGCASRNSSDRESRPSTFQTSKQGSQINLEHNDVLIKEKDKRIALLRFQKFGDNDYPENTNLAPNEAYFFTDVP